jgi:alpha-galactosidase
MKIPIHFKELGLSGSYLITDLWSGKVVGEFSGEFSPEINLHGAGLYRIIKVSK